MFSYFLLWRKVLCFGMCRWDLSDDYCGRPCRKIYIPGYIWHKSFIQTVKCSFSNQINVYQSFCGALLTLSYLFTSRKSCVSAVASASLWLVRYLLSKAFWRPCQKNCISGYIWHKSFIQKVKYSFPDERIVYRIFYEAPLIFSYFYLCSRKVVFRHPFQSRLLGPCFLVMKKSLGCVCSMKMGLLKRVSPVLFDKNQWIVDLKCLWNKILPPFFLQENLSLCCTDS